MPHTAQIQLHCKVSSSVKSSWMKSSAVLQTARAFWCFDCISLNILNVILRAEHAATIGSLHLPSALSNPGTSDGTAWSAVVLTFLFGSPPLRIDRAAAGAWVIEEWLAMLMGCMVNAPDIDESSISRTLQLPAPVLELVRHNSESSKSDIKFDLWRCWSCSTASGEMVLAELCSWSEVDSSCQVLRRRKKWKTESQKMLSHWHRSTDNLQTQPYRMHSLPPAS